MFDEQPKNEGAPGNLPVGQPPQDMFAGLENDIPAAPQSFPKALDSGALKKKVEIPPSSNQETDVVQTVHSESRSPVTGRILFGIIVLLLLGGLGAGGWWLFNYFKNKPAEVSYNRGSENTQNIPVDNKKLEEKAPQTEATSTETKVTNENILFGDSKDSDSDDLTDADETKFGTDPNNPDTDGDGIVDGDEIKIWKTDPLKKDTDGDSYSDSDEIKNGYNPLGGGKFLNIPMAIIRIVSSTASQKIPPVFDIVTIKIQK